MSYRLKPTLLLLALAGSASAQQVTANWTTASAGIWNTPSRWSTDPLVPNNGNGGLTYIAQTPPGNYQVTMNTDTVLDGLNVVGGRIKLDQHRLEIVPGGIVNLSNNNERFRLFFGTVKGGTWNVGTIGAGLQFEASDNYLDGLVINGKVVNNAGVHILNGLVLNGTWVNQGSGSFIFFEGEQSLTGTAEILFLNNEGQPKVLTGTNLTLAPSVLVHGENGAVYGQRIVNHGRISADVSGQQIVFGPAEFVNNGTLEAKNGGRIIFEGPNGGQYDHWSSTGTLRAGANSVLDLGGEYSIAGSTIDTAAGTVFLRDRVINTGSTLTLNSATGSWFFGRPGDISSVTGGTLITEPGRSLTTLASFRNDFINLAFDGTLNVAANDRFRVSGGSLDGVVTFGGNNRIDFDGNWTSSAVITAPAAENIALDGVFTLEQGFSLTRTGGTLELRGTLNNAGQVFDVNANTGNWVFSGTVSGSTINGGTIKLRDGATLIPYEGATLTGTTLDGTLDLTLAAGSLRISAGLSGGTLRLATGAAKVTAIDSLQMSGTRIEFNAPATPVCRLPIEADATLTLDPDCVVRGGRATLGGGSRTTGANARLVNNGLIVADVPGTTLEFLGPALTNGGSIGAAGGTLIVRSQCSVSNHNATTRTLTGGRWFAHGSTFTLSGRTVRNVDPGTVVEIDGATASFTAMNSLTSNAGEVAVTGGYVLNATPNNGTLTQFGTLRIGAASRLQVSGSFEQEPGADLHITVRTPAQFGRVVSTSDATLDGTLHISYDAYTPVCGDTFDLIQGSNLVGTFAALDLGGVQGSVRPTIRYLPDRVQLALVPAADFDGDGFLSGADFDLYVQAFEAGEIAADFDADDFITGVDFDLYVQAFEAGC